MLLAFLPMAYGSAARKPLHFIGCGDCWPTSGRGSMANRGVRAALPGRSLPRQLSDTGAVLENFSVGLALNDAAAGRHTTRQPDVSADYRASPDRDATQDRRASVDDDVAPVRPGRLAASRACAWPSGLGKGVRTSLCRFCIAAITLGSIALNPDFADAQ